MEESLADQLCSQVQMNEGAHMAQPGQEFAMCNRESVQRT